jgi:hypothetical protein
MERQELGSAKPPCRWMQRFNFVILSDDGKDLNLVLEFVDFGTKALSWVICKELNLNFRDGQKSVAVRSVRILKKSARRPMEFAVESLQFAVCRMRRMQKVYFGNSVPRL